MQRNKKPNWSEISAMQKLGIDFTALAGFWSRLRLEWDVLYGSRDSVFMRGRDRTPEGRKPGAVR